MHLSSTHGADDVRRLASAMGDERASPLACLTRLLGTNSERAIDHAKTSA
jgi:hypothetical protein